MLRGSADEGHFHHYMEGLGHERLGHGKFRTWKGIVRASTNKNIHKDMTTVLNPLSSCSF